jgi:hypothetical protein
MCLRNVGIYLWVHMESQPRKRRSLHRENLKPYIALSESPHAVGIFPST